jgi:hypothetical protein
MIERGIGNWYASNIPFRVTTAEARILYRQNDEPYESLISWAVSRACYELADKMGYGSETTQSIPERCE